MTQQTMSAPLSKEAPVSAEVRDAISEIKSCYFYYVDTKQWTKLRQVFADDARFEGFSFGKDGPDHFVDGAAKLLTGAVSVHHGCMPVFRTLDENHVKVRWSMHDYLTWEPGSKSFRNITSPDLAGFRAYGYYEEVYRRTSAGWRIAFMRLTRLRIDLIGLSTQSDDGYGALAPDLDWIP